MLRRCRAPLFDPFKVTLLLMMLLLAQGCDIDGNWETIDWPGATTRGAKMGGIEERGSLASKKPGLNQDFSIDAPVLLEGLLELVG